ncbi:sulfotransferase [Cognatishimia sp. F0-27]|nr:sulfotransferase [Cognatishimia sp. F0-27]
MASDREDDAIDPLARGPLPTFEPTPFPQGARMMFCIGAQKGGTSWLHDYLLPSPEVHFSPNKELHYFDVRAGRAEMALRLRIKQMQTLAGRLAAGKSALHPQHTRVVREALDLLEIYTGPKAGPNRHDPYLDYLLAGYDAQPWVADITPSYAVLDARHFADMAMVGEARFIFILRDPVARMWSHIRMMERVNHGEDTPTEEMIGHCAARAQILIDSGKLGRLERVNYRRTMIELEAAVPAERIKYVFFEDLFSGAATREICDFLGIAHRQPEGGRRVNEGKPVPMPEEIRAAFRDAFDPQYRFVRERFGDRVPEKWAV